MIQTAPAKLTEGPVGRHLVAMTAPVLLGTWFLGRVGDRELAAHAFSFPIIMIVTSISIGLGAGTSSVVARAIGAGDQRRARRLVTDSLLLSFLITLLIATLGATSIGPLFRLLGAPEDMIPLIRGFMLILYAGMPFLVVGMVGMASMRATGDTRLPSKLMVSAAILNVLLDPIFIFGVGWVPALGLNGAAVAALLARSIIFFGTLYLLLRRLQLISLERPELAELKRSWRDILHVGIPAAGTNAIVPVGAAVITAMIARYGADAVAGFGVANRIESMTLVFYYAMSAIIGPFVGQNLAAGKERRILEALRLCVLFAIGSGLVIALLLAASADFLPSLFSDSANVIGVAGTYLWIAPIGYGGYGVVMVVNATFNGLGKPMPGVAISVGRMLVLYLPLALIGMFLFDARGVFAAYTAANVVAGVLAYTWAVKTVRRHRRVSSATAEV
jgi:putative MATE family efflux protein